jgi:hypothetical protein
VGAGLVSEECSGGAGCVEDCSGETPSFARETRAVPRISDDFALAEVEAAGLREEWEGNATLEIANRNVSLGVGGAFN